MTLYLLDTNILSNLIDNPFGPIQRRVDKSPNDRICTSIIVAGELHFGALRRNSPSLTRRVEDALAGLEVYDFSPDSERHYAHIRRRLERAGTPIGGNDMLIAAHALALDAVLVTANTREFARIDGLKLENWLA